MNKKILSLLDLAIILTILALSLVLILTCCGCNYTNLNHSSVESISK